MRPTSLDDVFGQDHLLAVGKPLRIAVSEKIPHSMVFWGPPGSGKTTLARIIADEYDADLLTLSAVESGIKDIRNAVLEGRKARNEGRAAVLFVDEVHRFNKTQQDAFLPHIENGILVFIGATTENPSFELNSALLSRLKVYVLKPLESDDLNKIVDRCLTVGTGALPNGFALSSQAREIFVHAAAGDARRVLSCIEVAGAMVRTQTDRTVSAELAVEVAGQPIARFDKRGDVFFELISAMHKSIRGSDPDASLYWLARMLTGGCDPLYVARRVARIASEDIGNADPNALNVALNAWDAYHRLGTPEGELAIAQAVVYLACCPKSDAVYKAFGNASEDAASQGHLEVPMHLRNAPTRLMKDLGFGAGYRHAHNEQDGYAAGESYFPDGMKRRVYYKPVDRGVEKRIKEYMAKLRSTSGGESQN